MTGRMKYLAKQLAIASIGLMAGAALQAQAAPVAGLFNPAPAPTLLSDNSAELFLDRDASGNVSTDDIFITILGINTIEGTTIGTGTGFAEITAITAQKVLTAADVDLGPPGSDDSFGAQNIDLFTHTFVPLSAADATFFDWAAGTINVDGAGAPEFTFGTGGGATNNDLTWALVFEHDVGKDYTRDGTIQGGLTSATNGALRLRLDLVSANGDFLSAIAPDDVVDLLSLPPATAVDNSNISFDGTIAFQVWPGLNLGPNITGGNGGLSSPTTSSDFPIFDNLDFTVNQQQVVPEPGSLALLSLSLIALGAIGRRSRAKNRID